mmetsp:Transcript_35620/g.76070  ORF Transcript_35620/g.76070 Transcript_35620/m.76070 type:complete len:247 (+) Transcript_35620:405-1145(+)
MLRSVDPVRDGREPRHQPLGLDPPVRRPEGVREAEHGYHRHARILPRFLQRLVIIIPAVPHSVLLGPTTAAALPVDEPVKLGPRLGDARLGVREVGGDANHLVDVPAPRVELHCVLQAVPRPLKLGEEGQRLVRGNLEVEDSTGLRRIFGPHLLHDGDDFGRDLGPPPLVLLPDGELPQLEVDRVAGEEEVPGVIGLHERVASSDEIRAEIVLVILAAVRAGGPRLDKFSGIPFIHLARDVFGVTD